MLKKQNILNTLKLEQALRLAKQKVKDGSIDEAGRIYGDILEKFPKNKTAISGFKSLPTKKVRKSSGTHEELNEQLQLVIRYYNDGKFNDAKELAEVLIQKFPDSPFLYNVFGAVLNGFGKIELAISTYKKALVLKPDFVEALNNLGLAYQEQGNFSEALKAYKTALTIKSDFAEAFYNLGNLLNDFGRQKDAVEAYLNALNIRPTYFEALQNMSFLLKHAKFDKYNPKILSHLTKVVTLKSVARPGDIAVAALSLLKLDPKLKMLFDISDRTEISQSFYDTITSLHRSPLFLKLMAVCPLPDLEFEEALRRLRSVILLNIREIKCSKEFITIQKALALQCFTNEYIFRVTQRENEALDRLNATVLGELNDGMQPDAKVVLALASYKPLTRYEWSKLLRSSNELSEVITRQITEPQEEVLLKENIPSIGKINNNVSSKVKEQYENHPYPRWVNLGIKRPSSVASVVKDLKLKVQYGDVLSTSNPSILIAGCGTGQHSIGTASRFLNSNVLAIDLSLSSLAYAQRKTKELQIENIKYMQGDILTLRSLNESFNIIESSGVLHHMDDPIEGWKVLVDCLQPHGLMKIGLYSEYARQHITLIREEVKQTYKFLNQNDMKEFRSMLMTSEKSHHKLITKSSDFYSMSNMKDLIFHVQEHQFTIPKIKSALEVLGLEFCGFEFDKSFASFKKVFPDKNDIYDLDKWDSFERSNMRTFSNMYQFWCQKR